MNEETSNSRRTVFEFQFHYAKWRFPLLLASIALIAFVATELIDLLAQREGIEALLASERREDVIGVLFMALSCVVILAGTVFFWFGASRRQRLSLDSEMLRWEGWGGFAVPLASIRRLSVFGDDISNARYTIDTRTHGTKRFTLYCSPLLRHEIRPFLDEIERRTGLKWVGVSTADRPVDQRGIVETLKSSASITTKGQFARWLVERSHHVWIGDLGLNDKLVRGGYYILEARVLWLIAVAFAMAFALEPEFLWPPSRPLVLGLVFVPLVGIWIHTSLGVNIMLTQIRGDVRRRERLEHELDTARAVQERLAPRKTPQIRGFEIAGSCTPAREVGGDYYDYVAAADGGTVVAVADVSGKGLGPGLLMTLTKGALISGLDEGASLESALGKVNRAVRGSVAQNMFVSMALAKLSGTDGAVTVARAGHNPPLLVRSDGRTEWVNPPGVALGLASSEVFENACAVQQVAVNAGDSLLLYTDGLTEAMNAAAEEYGEERLATATCAARQLDATSMRDAILRDVADFRGGAEVNDDLTLVVIKANKRSESA